MIATGWRQRPQAKKRRAAAGTSRRRPRGRGVPFASGRVLRDDRGRQACGTGRSDRGPEDVGRLRACERRASVVVFARRPRGRRRGGLRYYRPTSARRPPLRRRSRGSRSCACENRSPVRRRSSCPARHGRPRSRRPQNRPSPEPQPPARQDPSSWTRGSLRSGGKQRRRWFTPQPLPLLPTGDDAGSDRASAVPSTGRP